MRALRHPGPPRVPALPIRLGALRAALRVTCPRRAEPEREALSLGVARPRQREHAPALVRRHLADDVGRGAEAVEADPLRVAAEPQRSIADQPGTEQRRRLQIRVALGDREAVALVGDRLLGVSPVELVAGEPGPLAEVLPARAAVAAVAIGPSQPRDPYPLTGVEALRPLPRRLDRADDLMTEDEGQLRLVEVAVGDVEVGPADAAGVNPHEHLPPARLRIGQPCLTKGLPLGVENHCPHPAHSPPTAAPISDPIAEATASGSRESRWEVTRRTRNPAS